MLDYKLIEAYAVVLREGGFDKGAKKLNLSQSAVSQRIKQLEEQFGQIIILRTSPPQPTQFGKKILRLYNQVRRIEDDFHRDSKEQPADSFTSLPIGLNADSLATWFLEAVHPFLKEHKVVFDLIVDDQEETHRLLREGRVLGCISTRKTAMQGCSAYYLGDVGYGLFCSPDFYRQWFSEGLTSETIRQAPMITFNRKDKLNSNILTRVLGAVPKSFSSFYVPSSEQFIDFIKRDVVYGALPEQQSRLPLQRGEIVELVPEQREQVSLYWHSWNLDSHLLRCLSRELVHGFSRIHEANHLYGE
ncbi:MAG: LysR family transcriptional regulator ArgP [Desulfocapsaceae bacterium]|nr:LysR family transcriptional regulator ArgP [Desulfocapsaceae bacterium]